MTLTREGWARQLAAAPVLAIDAIDQLRDNLELVRLAQEIVYSEDRISEKSEVRIGLLLEAFLSFVDEPVGDARFALASIKDSRPVGHGWQELVDEISNEECS